MRGSNNGTFGFTKVGAVIDYRAMRELLGEFKSRQIMEFWATDHYTWIYKTVLERPRDIATVLFKYKLLPVPQP